MNELQQQYEIEYKEHGNMATAALDLSKGINSDTEYKFACDFLLKIKMRLNTWYDKIDGPIKQANALHKSLTGVKKDIAQPLLRAQDEVLRPAILKYQHQQEESRRIAQDKLNEELRKQEEATVLAAAEELEKAGAKDLADMVLSEPIQPPTIIIPSTTKYDGISYRTTYAAEVYDIRALCRAVADGKIPETYVMANIPALNSMARNLKEAMNPQWNMFGVRAKQNKQVTASIR